MITIIGMGTGTPPPRITDATLVVGAARHLTAAELPATAERVVLGPLAPALDRIEAHLQGCGPSVRPRGDGGTPCSSEAESSGEGGHSRPAAAKESRTGRPRAAVLASGDPGFFGITRALAARFGPDALDIQPAPSSIALAFAGLGLPWDDAAVVTAHGRALRTAVNVCRSHPKTAVLTGPGAGPAELGAALAGTPRTLVVCAALGTPAETLVRMQPEEAAAHPWPEAVNVVLCLDEARTLATTPRTLAGPPRNPTQWALPEEDFAHRDGLITKYEVRALALARLAPRPGDLIWDVGAGSGSLAVECARLGAAAIAVEKAPDAVARIRANATAHGVDVHTVQGTAPAALPELPAPDAVFIGGGGTDLPAIVTACAERRPRAVVVTLAALDRVAAVRERLTAAGLSADGVLLQSSRLSPLPGNALRLAAANPVFVLWGRHPAPQGDS